MKKNTWLLLAALIFYHAGRSQTFTVSAKQQWVATDISLNAGENFEAAATGPMV